MRRFPKTVPPPPRSSASLADARDLRGVVSALLADADADERTLRQAVWNFVGTERAAGVSSGRTILELTELVEAAPIATLVRRQLLLRSVILWCVEADFGHLGGDAFRRHAGSVARLPPLDE